MSTTTKRAIHPAVVDQLLQLPTLEQQISFLDSAALLDEQGLSQLLAHAMTLVHSDPGQARRLTLLCADMAEQVGLLPIVPRATYLRAQTHAINGEFNIALQLIKAARASYEAIGEQIEALRTNIGLMHVLNELGRHQEALEAGQSVIEALSGAGKRVGENEQITLLIGLVNQNRGVCYSTIGRNEEALQAYAEAEAAFMALGMRERIADVNNNRGIVLMQLGRVSEALTALETAAATWAEAGRTLPQAQTLSNIGEAHLLLGNYTRSLETFEQARRLFDSLDAQAPKHILLRRTADAYLVLNLAPEAVDAYHQAIHAFEDAGMSIQKASALWGMGSALIAQGQFDEANEVLSEAGSLFAAADNVPMLCSVMLEQAAVQNARGDHDRAISIARRALELVEGNQWPVQLTYAYMRMADLLMPDSQAAEPCLLAARELADRLALPHIDYLVNRRMGSLRMLQGRDEEAEAYLEAAVAQIERLRGTLAEETLRISFLQDKTAAYEALMQFHLARADESAVRRAFTIAEQAKSRTLVDLLTGGIEVRQPLPDQPELVERLDALQADLNAIYNEFLGNSERERALSLPELHERAVALEREIHQLRLKVEGRLIPPDPFTTPLSLESLKDQLPEDTLLLAYHIVGEEIMTFAYWKGEIHLTRHISQLATVQGLLQRLTIQWDRFRAGSAFAQRHMALLERSTQRILAALYQALIAPLDPFLQQLPSVEGGARKVAIVPHGLLHQVPFHALYDGKQYLLDGWEISYAPSTTVFTLCQQRAREAARRAVVVGLADELIPAVQGEVQMVAAELATAGVHAELLENEQATLATIRESMPRGEWLHFACHGLFRADNPMFSSLQLYDGWLTAADVLQLDLTGALVTLSACESGRSQVFVGDELIGLSRAFLGAGASTLVVTLWLVQDETTASLMQEWYALLSDGVEPAAALRQAQRALKARHPHPYYWAPFILVGKR